MQTLSIVLVEDDPGDARLVQYTLKYSRVKPSLVWLGSLGELKEHLVDQATTPDVILLDLNLPDSTGMATVTGCKALSPETPVVVLTGHDDMEFAVRALEAGAQDYLVKGNLDADSLLRSMRYAIGRAKLEQRLVLSEERMAAAIEGAKLGVWDWLLPSEQLISLSERWLTMLGFHSGNSTLPAAAETWIERIHPEDRAAFDNALASHLQGEAPNFQCEIRLLHRQEHWVWVLVSGHVVGWDAEGRAQRMVGVQQDISERKLMEQRLEELAMRAPLTGLSNRRHFMQAIDREHGRVKRNPGLPVSVLMLDIDHFKRVNDTYGHAGGDEVLKAFSTSIRRQLREMDMAGRLGGEEFAVLLPDTDAVGSRRVAEKLRQAVEAMCVTLDDKSVVQVTTSVGLTRILPDDTRPDGALARADSALYRAKTGGRNRVEVCVEVCPLLDEESGSARLLTKREDEC